MRWCMPGLLDGRWGAWLRLVCERLAALRRYSAVIGHADWALRSTGLEWYSLLWGYFQSGSTWDAARALEATPRRYKDQVCLQCADKARDEYTDNQPTLSGASHAGH